MNIGNAKLGTVISIELIQAFLQGLQRIGTIPESFEGVHSGANFIATIEPLEFEMFSGNDELPYTRLHLVGTVSLDTPAVTLALNTWVRFSPELVPAPNQPEDAPLLVFRYDGVDVPPAAPLTEAMIDTLFTDGPVANILSNISISLLDTLIGGAAEVIFSEEDNPAPSRGLWVTQLALMPVAANQDETVDALGIFVDIPGGDAMPGDTQSFLPRLTEFAVVYSRSFLDLEFEKQDLTGQTLEGAEVTEFSVVMGDTAILVNGRATKDIADIHFSGPIAIELMRGTTQFLADTSDIDVDVDLPWWADIFLFLVGTGGMLSIGLIPIFGGMIFKELKGKSVSEAQAELDAAPSIVRGSIARSLAAGISSLAQSLSNLGPLGALQPASTPDTSLVEDGNIALFAQVLVNPLTENIADGTFSRRANQLLELQLESGRWFTTSELARIVDLGLIITPGYRAISPHTRNGLPVRGYMQDEPDLATDDNLLVRFGT